MDHCIIDRQASTNKVAIDIGGKVIRRLLFRSKRALWFKTAEIFSPYDLIDFCLIFVDDLDSDNKL